MHKSKKYVSTLLALLFSLALLSACSDSSNKSIDTTANNTSIASEEEGTTSYIDALPQTDFEGYEFRVIGQNTASRQNFFMEEKEGDIVNDSIHSRDLAVTERLNVNFVYISKEERSAVIQDVQKVIASNDEAYDMIINALSEGINTLTSNGYLYDLKNIPYLDFGMSHWNKSMLENMAINDKLYFTTGPISPSFLTTPIAMAMNKRLAADYNVGDIYQIVLDGDWTVDKLHTLTKDLAKDLDNNGVMNENDFYGLVFDGTFGNVLFNSSGFKSVEKDGDQYRLTIGDERAVDIITTLATKFGSRDMYFNDRNGAGTSEVVFRAGNALFMNYTMLGISSFRDLKDDFAIIPTPKYNESQDKYPTTCNTWLPSGVAVPKLCSNPERTGLIMETMAYVSNELIVPAYYEITLQGKVSRDDESVQMLEIIYRDASFDMVTSFNFGDSAVLIREAVLGEKQNYVSALASISKQAQAALDKITEFALEES